MRILLAWAAYLLLAQLAALAQSTPEELRKIARNPFADQIELRFEDDVTFSQGPFDRTAKTEYSDEGDQDSELIVISVPG